MNTIASSSAGRYRGTSVAWALLPLALLVSPRTGAQTIGARVVDQITRRVAYPLSVRVLDDGGVVVATAQTDSNGIFYANLEGGARRVHVHFLIDATRWADSDTLTVGADEFVQREFRIPFMDAYDSLHVATQVSQRRGIEKMHYPDALRLANITGDVLAQFIVDSTGRVRRGSFVALRATHSEFAAAVSDALPFMRFNPATLAGGKKVAQLVQQEFTFALEVDPGEAGMSLRRVYDAFGRERRPL